MLVGNVAISSGGGPILGFCGGRTDDLDGSASLPLGPGDIQNSLVPCEENGLCEYPHGASTIGLIYVNPAGPINATGDPAESAHDIRRIFGNMGFNDRESVALIGGGHAFGKVLPPDLRRLSTEPLSAMPLLYLAGSSLSTCCMCYVTETNPRPPHTDV